MKDHLLRYGHVGGSTLSRSQRLCETLVGIQTPIAQLLRQLRDRLH